MKDGGCCVFKKSLGDSFLRDFEDIFGPQEIKTPADAVNDLLTPKYKTDKIPWHGKE